MTRVFVSCERIDRSEAVSFLEALAMGSFEVEHSPRNPVDGPDARWREWYECGLPSSLDRVEAFIIILTPGWESSTWMAAEGEEALNRYKAGTLRAMYFVNPQSVDLGAVPASMKRYLIDELPAEGVAALQELMAST